MMNRTIAGRLVMVRDKNLGTGRYAVCKPDFQEFTLIMTDGRGRTISEEKVLVDVNRIFKTA